MMNPQKCLLYNNTAFPLLDFPEGEVPQAGDKCLLIRDRNSCIPVYQNAENEMLTDGNALYALVAEDKSKEETGEEISKRSSVF